MLKKNKYNTLLAFACLLLGPALTTQTNAQETPAVLDSGSIIIGYDDGACNEAATGTLRYNSNGGSPLLEFCDGTAWISHEGDTTLGSGGLSLSADFSGGSVKIGYDSRTCDGTLAGALRYNSGSGIEFCNGSAWTATGE